MLIQRLVPQIDNRDKLTATIQPWKANSTLFCAGKSVRYSDFVKYSDVKEEVIEDPRVFVEIKKNSWAPGWC